MKALASYTTSFQKSLHDDYKSNAAGEIVIVTVKTACQDNGLRLTKFADVEILQDC